jgi:hypothetical protein
MRVPPRFPIPYKRVQTRMISAAGVVSAAYGARDANNRAAKRDYSQFRAARKIKKRPVLFATRILSGARFKERF